jgi:hypothetical protein
VQRPLLLRGLIGRGIGSLPKGELRRKTNKKLAITRNRQRSPQGGGRPKAGLVYFIRDAVTLTIKIGFCLKRPEKRLAVLQTGNSNPLRLIGHVLGSEPHEKALHKRFARFRLQGEWFAKELLPEIEAILNCSSVEEWMKTQDLKLPKEEVPAVVVIPSSAVT